MKNSAKTLRGFSQKKTKGFSYKILNHSIILSIVRGVRAQKRKQKYSELLAGIA